MQISPKSPGLVTVEHQEQRFLGLQTSLPVRGIPPATLEAVSRPGIEVEGAVIRDWPVVGRVGNKGTLVFYGPDRSVVPLLQTLGSESGTRNLGLLRAALNLYRERGLNPEELGLELVLVTDSGGLLFFRDELVHTLLPRARGELAPEASYSLPELRGEPRLAAVITAFLYRHHCGAWPVERGDAAERRDRMRRGMVDDPVLHAPAVGESLARELQQLCSRAFRGRLSLEDALSALQWLGSADHTKGQARGEGRVADASPGAGAGAIDAGAQGAVAPPGGGQEARKRAAQMRDMWYRLRRFLGNRWRALIAGGLLAALVLSIPLGMIRGALAPPSTAGLGAPELVREFYTSLGELDRETMADATWRNAGASLIDLATNLFVIGRVRASVEFREPFMDAATWLALPEGERERGTVPVGVLDLSLAESGAGEEFREYRVNYVLYVPGEGAGPDGLPFSESAEVTETVRVERRRGNWYITEIRGLNTEQN